MVALHTPDVLRGWKAPDFSLPAVDGKHYTLENLKGENGLLIMFICNHCPFVQAILDKLIRDVKELQSMGIGVAAIMSNDTESYPDDSFDNMKVLATEEGFPFPYLFDKTQEVAKNYGAVCTPDFFGFDKNLMLEYRGRLDDSGMHQKEGGERELFHAMKMIAETGKGPEVQHPSIGCSIKWKSE